MRSTVGTSTEHEHAQPRHETTNEHSGRGPNLTVPEKINKQKRKEKIVKSTSKSSSFTGTMFGSIKNVHYAVKASVPLTQSRSNEELTLFFFPTKHTDKTTVQTSVNKSHLTQKTWENKLVKIGLCRHFKVKNRIESNHQLFVV